jgi:hypothetical protein
VVVPSPPTTIDAILSATGYQLRELVADIESAGDGTRIESFSVYLNQGTKEMNIALIVESLVFAMETGAEVEFFECSAASGRDSATTSVISDVGAVDARSIARTVLETTETLRLLRMALSTLNIAQARDLLGLLPNSIDKALLEQIRQFLSDVERPFLNMKRGVARLGPAARLIPLLRHVYGIDVQPTEDRVESYIGQLSTVLSAASLPPGGTEEEWKKHPSLKPLWKIRNKLFHDDSLLRSDIDVVRELGTDAIIHALADVLESAAPSNAADHSDLVHRYNQLVNDLQAVEFTLTSKEPS